MSTPDTTGWNDASLSHLPDHIRRAIEITPAAGTSERIIDITTLGRRTGRPRCIEIFFYRAAGATYLCSAAGGAATDWHANLLANPTFTFHLKNRIRADLPARATPVTDPAERHAVLAEIVADLNQPHDPGTIRPTRLHDWADSRLMRISFSHRP
jgi:deazaflavin-dependent oxidoreductase (nitroreductase family)